MAFLVPPRSLKKQKDTQTSQQKVKPTQINIRNELQAEKVKCQQKAYVDETRMEAAFRRKLSWKNYKCD